MATISNLVVNLFARTSAFERGMRKSRHSVYGLQRSVLETQRKLFAFGKALITAGAIYKTVRAYAEFEKQLANVSTMLDEHSMRLMPAYTAALRMMAIEFGESTETLSKGLYDILSASVAPEKALSVLEASVKAAKAGMSDAAIAADAITTILNSYGLAAEEATKVSDILFAIIKRGKTTFVDLAPNIGKVAAIAASAGLSLEELGAATATLTRAGLQTEIAITALRSIINAFLKPTKQSIEAAARFGIELNTTTLRTQGLVYVLKKLRSASAEQLAQIIPNTRGLAGFAAALKAVDSQAEDLELMLHSVGMTQEAYEKQTDTLSHSLSRLNESFKSFLVMIGERMRPVIKGVADMLSGLAELGQTKPPGAEGLLLEEKRLRFYANALKQLSLIVDPGHILEEKLGTHEFWRKIRPTGWLGILIEKEAIDMVFKANEKLREYNQLQKEALSHQRAFVGQIERIGPMTNEAYRQMISDTISYNEQLIEQDKRLGMVNAVTYILIERNEELRKKLTEIPIVFSEAYSDMESKIIKFNVELEKQISLFDLTGPARQLRELTEQFNILSDTEKKTLQPLIDRAERLMNQFDALNEKVKAAEQIARKDADIKRKIESIIESTLTPLEKYEKRISELHELLEAGLPWENYARAVKAARDELENAAEAVKQFRDKAGEMEEIRLAFVSPAGLRMGLDKIIPKVEIPEINIPKIIPEVEIPKIDVPKIIPKVEIPDIDISNIDLPEISFMQPKVPALGGGTDMQVKRLDIANEHLSRIVVNTAQIASKEGLG